MIVDNNNTIINLREKFLESQKRKGNISNNTHSQNSISSSKDVKAESRQIADIIAIKQENILASNINTVRHEEDAQKLLDELKNSLKNNPKTALDAHKKVDTNKIMGFYPFD
jgi:hypothetical protein